VGGTRQSEKKVKVDFLVCFSSSLLVSYYIDCRIFYEKRQEDRQKHKIVLIEVLIKKDALLLVIMSDVILHFIPSSLTHL
jgi:hypothetical protein